MTKLFGVKNVFSNPKPIELIKGLIQIANVKCGDIVLDFFSGSSTTAHSVIALNVEDKVNIRHIMVQLPESLDMLLGDADSETKKTIRNSIEFLDSINKPHFLTEIGKERIRRAGEGIKAELQKKYDEYQNRQQTILDDEEAPINPGDLDIGFKVFKLDDSNLKKWSVDVGDDFYKEDIETQNAILSEKLGIEVDNFVEGRSELDVVYEIMLTYGLDLSYPIETYDINGTNIYSIGSGALIVCLDEDIRAELADKIIEIITKEEPSLVRVVARDLSFVSDSAKTNFKETLKNGVNAYFEGNHDKSNKQNQFKFITI
ncbi:MAG TPA: DNA methyltransferase [Candidatus Cloacimonadota bacterium]|nr:DNA methyltransferase [Candidatus Cloacimonadota bacterium]